MSTAETISAITEAALIRTQEVPAHSPSQVSRLARPSGLGNVCSKACWGKPVLRGSLAYKISHLQEVSSALVPIKVWGLGNGLFPCMNSPEKTNASTFNNL